MAVRQIVISDLSGAELDDSNHARLVITEHPKLNGPIELDVLADEAQKIESASVELVMVDVYAPNAPRRSVALEVDTLKKLFPKANIDEVLQNARKAASQPTQAKRQRRASAPSGEKVDYTAKENFGVIHRGKVTEEEAKLVRENIEQANANRARHGQPPVGHDPKDKLRYGLPD